MGARKTPFIRVKEAFDEEIARAPPCHSSGSDHSSSDFELSDLVNSFMEGDYDDDDHQPFQPHEGDDVEDEHSESSSQVETERDTDDQVTLLKSFLGDGVDEGVKGMIHQHLTNGITSVDEDEDEDDPQGFKRMLMTRLRQRGLDAGLCKSRIKKVAGQIPSGNHEYIDVTVDGIRYIVELNLAKEFTIARPTSHYQSLLHQFPAVFVGEIDDLKQVVKLMCTAARKSIKNRDMHLAPWRKYAYVLAKWFGSYKRTTNSATKNTPVYAKGSARELSVGFDMSSATVLQNCRGDLSRKPVMRVGNLAQMLDDSDHN